MWFNNLMDRIRKFFERRTPGTAPATPAQDLSEAPGEKVGFFRSLGRGLLKVGSVIVGAVGWLLGGGAKIVVTVAGWVVAAVAAVAIIILLVVFGVVFVVVAAVAYLLAGIGWVANYIWDGSRFLLIERATPGTTVETNLERWALYRSGEQDRRSNATETAWDSTKDSMIDRFGQWMSEDGEESWVEVTDDVTPKEMVVSTDGTVTVPGDVVEESPAQAKARQDAAIRAKADAYDDEFFTPEGLRKRGIDPKKHDFAVHNGDFRVLPLYLALANEALQLGAKGKADFSFWSGRAFARDEILNSDKPVVALQLQNAWTKEVAKKDSTAPGATHKKNEYTANQGKNGVTVEVKCLKSNADRRQAERYSEADDAVMAKASEKSQGEVADQTEDEVSKARAKKSNNDDKAGV